MTLSPCRRIPKLGVRGSRISGGRGQSQRGGPHAQRLRYPCDAECSGFKASLEVSARVMWKWSVVLTAAWALSSGQPKEFAMSSPSPCHVVVKVGASLLPLPGWYTFRFHGDFSGLPSRPVLSTEQSEGFESPRGH